jgi:hypothetical protein
VPAGLVVGRWAWTAVAGALRVVERAPIPVVAIAVTVVATFVAAAVLAAGPGRRFGRIQPATVLRAE